MQRAAMIIGTRGRGKGASMLRAARSLAALLAASAGLALTQGAHAETYYVRAGAKSGDGLTPQNAFGSITEAVDAAWLNSGPDTVIVGPGDYQEWMNMLDAETVLIADTMGSHFAGVDSKSYSGDHSVVISSGSITVEAADCKMVGFLVKGQIPITLAQPAGTVFEFIDCWLISGDSQVMSLNGDGQLNLTRCKMTGPKNGITVTSKSSGANILLKSVEAEVGYSVINLETSNFGTAKVFQSWLKSGLPAIALQSGTLGVYSSVFQGNPSVVDMQDPSAVQSLQLLHNTMYDVGTVIDGTDIGTAVEKTLTISLANNLVAYSGVLVNAECGKSGCSGITTSNNLEWLSRTDKDTDDLVAKAGSINDLLTGFVDASGGDFRLTTQATDALGQADDNFDFNDYFGVARGNNGSTDIGAFEKRPMTLDTQLAAPAWWDKQYANSSKDWVALPVYRPMPDTFLEYNGGRIDFSEWIGVLQGSYEEDQNTPELRNPNGNSISRVNYIKPGKWALEIGGVNGWFDPGTTQAIALKQGGRDHSSQLLFDLWVADATPSPAVVSVRVNGQLAWRHTILAGQGDSAPPVTGWSLPAMPEQAVGDLFGDKNKNDLGFIGIRIPDLYKYLSESEGKGDLDLIEISVDNCTGWALDNITVSSEQFAWDNNYRAPFRETTLESGLGFYKPSLRTGIFPRALMAADTGNYGQLDIFQGSSRDASGDSAKEDTSTTWKRSIKGEVGLFTTEAANGIDGQPAMGLGLLDVDNDGIPEVAELRATGTDPATLVYNVYGSPLGIVSMDGKPYAGVGTPRALGVGDMNADGWCDLVVLGSGANAVQLGSGSISKSSQTWDGFSIDLAMLPQSKSDVGSGDFLSMADVNNDGVPDIFYPFNGGRLWQSTYNTSSKSVTFANVSRGINIGLSRDVTGNAWGDYNNDGYVDLVVPNRAGNLQLWKNPGAIGGLFTDVASSAGLAAKKADAASAAYGAAAAWGDYDNDGDLDLAMTTGTPGSPDAIRLFKNSGAPTYTFERAYDFGADATCEGGDIRFIDYDNNGFLDLLVSSDSDNYPTRIFRNELRDNNNEPNTDNFLKVRVVGRGAGALNMAGIGARVELWDEAGKNLLARRDVALSQGLGGMDTNWVHFGGTTWNDTYLVRVFGPGGYSFQQKVTPGKESTTIGSNTISNMVTMDERELRPGFNVRSYTEVAPDKEIIENDGKK
jgi:hypothetical protein